MTISINVLNTATATYRLIILLNVFQFIDSESVPESVEDSLPDTDAEEKMAPTYDEAFPPLAGKTAVGGMAGKL